MKTSPDGIRDPDESAERESDERLMRRCAARDVAAFAMLIERHHPRALGFAFHLTGDPEVARDATQEAFLRIFRGARGYSERGFFRSYLFQVVRNTVRELARRQRRRREDRLETMLETGHNSARAGTLGRPGPDSGRAKIPEQPDQILEKKTMRDRLARALQALPEDLRAVFVLSEIEGCSYRDIGRICRCPMGTVASRKHAAVERLQALLRDVRTP